MNDQQVTTVMVIDDHPLIRKGVADLVSLDSQLQFVGEAANGEEGIALVRTLHPDIVLLDLEMKGMHGIDTLMVLKKDDSINSRIIMLTVSDNNEHVVAALKAGADGYLLKDMEPEQLLDTLRLAAKGRTVISEELTDLMARALRDDATPRSIDSAGLTERETAILGLLAKGFSNKVIARELDITEGTVKVHVKHILRKLNLRSRVEAAVWAVSNKYAL